MRVLLRASDQQPRFFFALPDPRHSVAAAQFVAAQVERDVAAREPFRHVVASSVGIRAVIPDHDTVGSTSALGDDSLERRILQRMVFGAPGHPLISGADRWAVTDLPRHQNSVDLQTKVVVIAVSQLMLNDEARAVSRNASLSSVPATRPIPAQKHGSWGTRVLTGKTVEPITFSR